MLTGPVAYFNIWGSSDAKIYNSASANNSPNSDGFVFEVDYTPFGKDDSWLQP